MGSETYVLELSNPQGYTLRLRFEKQQDRFRHHWDVLDGDNCIPILVSREGVADDAWPMSPPVIELHRATLSDKGDALLGTGAAGRSYWSLSAHAEERGFLLDVACRSSDNCGGWLGSTYLCLTAGAAADSGHYRCAVPRHPCSLIIATTPSAATHMLTIDDQLQLTPPLANFQSARWSYCVFLQED